jgi:hypothetical protein
MERKGYLCGMVLLYRSFFSFELGSWRAETGVMIGGDGGAMGGTFVPTLGSCVISGDFAHGATGITLGDGGSVRTGSGILSTRLSCHANVSKALRTGSPASKLGVVVDGGCVRIVIISVAACLRKSTNFI